MTVHKSPYRPDIDGLRALAVLAVLLFHLDPGLLPGGFLGVDVFFVISGFLITSIIAREMEAGEFSFVRFYERRIRRIVPALMAVLVASTIAAWVWWSPADLKNYGRSLERVMMGMSNVHFLNTSQDYFNDEAHRAPLLHTWSLAVEEQYYFVFPLLWVVLFKGLKKRSRVTGVLAGVCCLSLVLGVWRGIASPMTSFFLLPFRAWEILTGSLLALSRFRTSDEKTASIEGGAGLLLVLGSFVFLGERTFVPGLSALPGCLGAALLLRSGAHAESMSARVLSWRPLVFVGLISYSVYLWHWPLIVFSTWVWGGGGNALLPVGLFATSLLLGWISWKWIEQPFRRSQRVGKKSVWLFWGATTACFMCFGSWVRRAGGVPERFPTRVRELFAFKQQSELRTENDRHYDPKRAPVYGDPSATPTIALWGDSHSEALIPVLDGLAKEYKRSFKAFGFPGQVPVVGMIRQDGPGSLEKRVAYMNSVLDEIAKDPALSTVVLHGRWSSPNRGRNETRNSDPYPVYQRKFHSDAERDAYYLGCIRATVDRLLAARKRVIFVGPVPEIGFNVPDYLARQALRGESLSITVKCEDFARRHAYLLDELNSWKKRDDLIVILPHERLLTGDDARISLDGKPLYRDDDHLSSVGANYLREWLRPILLENRGSLATSPLR